MSLNERMEMKVFPLAADVVITKSTACIGSVGCSRVDEDGHKKESQDGEW